MTGTLTEFLLARLAEDEAVAKAAIEDDQGQDGGMEDSFDLLTGCTDWFGAPTLPKYADAIARLITHTAVPARVLADVEAKRAVVARWKWADEHHDWSSDMELDWDNAFGTLCDLAQPYRDHPDFDPGWPT